MQETRRHGLNWYLDIERQYSTVLTQIQRSINIFIPTKKIKAKLFVKDFEKSETGTLTLLNPDSLVHQF